MRILLASDGSQHSKAALHFLARLPFGSSTELVLISVIEELGLPRILDRFPGALAELQETLYGRTREHLLNAARRCADKPWSVTTLVRTGHPADELVAAVDELQSDLIVLGSRGASGFAGYLLGAVSFRVAVHSPCSVLLVRPKERDEESDLPEKKDAPLEVLLALDGSRPSKTALRSLAGLPFGERAQVRVLSVLDLVGSYRMDILQKLSDVWIEEKESAQEELNRAAAALGNFSAVQTQLQEGEDIAREILKTAREIRADLIVLGNKGRSAIERFLLGSVSSKVAHHAPCSVLIVKGRGFPASKS